MAPSTDQTQQERFKSLLRDQLEYLRASAESYDRGNHNEAKRMATTMRLLFSNSKKSAGLIFQMAGKDVLLLRLNRCDDT